MARTRPDPYQLEPGAEGQVLRVVGGTATWVDPSTMAGDIGAITDSNIAEGVAPGSGITGTPNGTASAFVLASAAVDEESIHVYLDGLRMLRGTGNDYTVLGDLQTIVFEYAPAAGQNLIVDYRV
jgi:hypothetical protein